MEIIRTRREETPYKWAALHYNLGRVFRDTGILSGDPSYFKASEEAYLAALEVLTREQEAEQWASSWNQLAATYRVWGEREQDAGKLEKTVECYRNALKYWVPAQCLKCWAMTRYNMGSALLLIGNWELSPVHWLGAVEEFYKVLGVRSRTTAQVDWPLMQYRLAQALFMLGKEASGRAELSEAYEAITGALSETSEKTEASRYKLFSDLRTEIEEALTARTKPGKNRPLRLVSENPGPKLQVPENGTALPRREMDANLERASDILVRAEALRARAERTQDIGLMKDAVSLFRQAADSVPRSEHPVRWGAAQYALGLACAAWGTMEPAGEGYADAIKAFHSNILTLSPEQNPDEWKLVHFALGSVLLEKDAAAADNEALSEAAAAFKKAEDVISREREPDLYAQACVLRGEALSRLGRRNMEPDLLITAVACFDKAMEQWTRESAPDKWQFVRDKRRSARKALVEMKRPQ